jgi:hypothetical protein
LRQRFASRLFSTQTHLQTPLVSSSFAGAGFRALNHVLGSSVPLVSWSVIEAGCYLLAACLPHLRPVFLKHCPSWLEAMFSSTFNRSNKGTTGNTYELKRSRRDLESSLGYSQLDSSKDVSGQRPATDWDAGKGSSEFKFEAAAVPGKPNRPRHVPIDGINVQKEVMISRNR